MNNDYMVGELTRQRHADYLDEVKHDERVAEARRRQVTAEARSTRPTREHPVPHGWRRILAGLTSHRPMAHGHGR
jgi:hypothetical protein